jgi:hypothetical protein
MSSLETENEMATKKIVAALLFSVAALPGHAFAASPPPPAHAHCILSQHQVTGVQPLRVTQRYGRGASEKLVGAKVFVQAEPGLTAEWLQLTIQRHIAQMGTGAMKDCALDTKDVRMSVESAGPGFVVKIIGKDPAQAKEILRRAQLLAG